LAYLRPRDSIGLSKGVPPPRFERGVCRFRLGLPLVFSTKNQTTAGRVNQATLRRDTCGITIRYAAFINSAPAALRNAGFKCPKPSNNIPLYQQSRGSSAWLECHAHKLIALFFTERKVL